MAPPRVVQCTAYVVLRVFWPLLWLHYYLYTTDCRMYISGADNIETQTHIYNWLLEIHLFTSKALQRGFSNRNPCSSWTNTHSLYWWMAPASIQLPNLEHGRLRFTSLPGAVSKLSVCMFICLPPLWCKPFECWNLSHSPSHLQK